MTFNKIFKILDEFKLILIVTSIIIFVTLFHSSIPLNIKIILFTISHIIRMILMFLLPFLIFPYLVSGISNTKTKSIYLIIGVFLLILLSNFISIMVAYVSATNLIPLIGINQMYDISGTNEMLPLINIQIKPLIGIETVIIISITLGIILNYYKNEKAQLMIKKYINFSSIFFNKVYIPLIPLYILGTLLKTSYEINFYKLLTTFGTMIIVITITQTLYILFLFYLSTSCSLQRTIQAIKNASSAAIVGFSTMSSLITMPVTLKAAEKNIGDKNLAHFSITTTVNCHDVGECISLPMIALTLYYIINSSFPDLSVYGIFAILVSVAQFGSVSIPGGSVIIILPFLEKYLNFDSNMLNLIIAISVFMDPIGTANNILGNSAFAMIISNIYKKISKIKNFFDNYCPSIQLFKK